MNRFNVSASTFVVAIIIMTVVLVAMNMATSITFVHRIITIPSITIVNIHINIYTYININIIIDININIIFTKV